MSDRDIFLWPLLSASVIALYPHKCFEAFVCLISFLMCVSTLCVADKKYYLPGTSKLQFPSAAIHVNSSFALISIVAVAGRGLSASKRFYCSLPKNRCGKSPNFLLAQNVCPIRAELLVKKLRNTVHSAQPLLIEMFLKGLESAASLHIFNYNCFKRVRGQKNWQYKYIKADL